jgi:starch synthase (maltosyl-transferring)
MEKVISTMTPEPGERLQRFVGDRVRFFLKNSGTHSAVKGWCARLRTNLGRAETLRREIIQAHTSSLPFAGASWRDLPMNEDGDGWSLDLPLAEVGFFKAKAYFLDPKGWQHWPEGPDVGVSVHPNAYRTANTIYCAFPRLFGATKTAVSTRNAKLEEQIEQIEDHGFTIIPPSGKLRDLIQGLPHIIETLGCRVLHLLPVNPTPTTYARFGRFGSPYAALDLTAIDPALVVFDKRTTGVDQFRELTYATHLRGARVFLDIVINHTGWGSMLQENHPGWFLRNPDGTFQSPGAWGTTWEDLVELKHNNVVLWDQLAEMFLIWCRRGVDGFRCDAGYKVPLPAWQYIIARVQQEYPETIFLLEGLGGSWDATEALLTEGGMQWAYSELFQNYSGRDVAWYLDYALRQSERVGVYVHYSETHDNNRLAIQRAANLAPAEPNKPDRTWSLLRNRLCALTSVSGGFGFTCGVEWLATEKIRVHGSTGLAWGSKENLLPELVQLNHLLAEHPCFFDGAKLTRLSPDDSQVYALLRESSDKMDSVLVLVNNDADNRRSLTLALGNSKSQVSNLTFDLLGQVLPDITARSPGEMQIVLPAGASYCLSSTAQPRGLSGEAYRRARAQAAWAVQALSDSVCTVGVGDFDWRTLSQMVDASAFRFLAAVQHLDRFRAKSNLISALQNALAASAFPQVIRWNLVDRRRITPVPPDHWLLIEDKTPFRASLHAANGARPQNIESIAAADGHVACFPPRNIFGDARLYLERYTENERQVEASIRFLAAEPRPLPAVFRSPPADSLVLLTNGIGGMVRMCADLGRVQSKYDCVLGANLHPQLPVDRHIFAKRIRAWVNADGFISPLDFQSLVAFEPGVPAVWQFIANAGDGRTVEIEMRAEMLSGQNTTVFRFIRPSAAHATGKQLPADADVRLTVRVDIEDRSFHSETKRNAGTEHHFASNTRELQNCNGFAFTPANDRQLRVFAEAGVYHPQAEWCENISHSIEQSRGQTGSGDAFSPGWFEVPMPKGTHAALIVTADPAFVSLSEGQHEPAEPRSSFEAQLEQAARAFVIRRGSGKTIIAGYPWFLDWGRDTFICARGLLAAGMTAEVKDILVTFARFEQDGTLPNNINGEDASNRDTSDAPLWFGVVCEELAALRNASPELYDTSVNAKGRTIRDILISIATNYMKGTPNGIRMDAESGLIWSPSHFTWMDTNYPAGTPREGYPIEIQALWIRLLRQLALITEAAEQRQWADLAARALVSLEKLFWLEERGWYADLLSAKTGQPASQSTVSDALRSNCLFVISLGIVSGDRATRCVAAAQQYLLVPGGLRTLAPLSVSVPLPVYGNHGGLLNHPTEPYWGHYEGDEDTRRKPAYHNGTAWTWTFPVFCEALARAWDFNPAAVAAASAYLGSVDRILATGCLGQIPEILDGDAPHLQRGCDAQAWGVTETLRVWRNLK